MDRQIKIGKGILEINYRYGRLGVSEDVGTVLFLDRLQQKELDPEMAQNGDP